MSDASDEVQTDAADEATIARAHRRVRVKAKEGAEFWKTVFSDPVGRAEMWKLLVDAHTFEERFACGPNGFPQPEATWFHAGEQSFGQRLYQSWLLRDLQGVALMHAECDPRFPKPKK